MLLTHLFSRKDSSFCEVMLPFFRKVMTQTLSLRENCFGIGCYLLLPQNANRKRCAKIRPSADEFTLTLAFF